MDNLSSNSQAKALESLDSWKYQILFGIWLGGTAFAFHRIRRQPFRQAVKVEQYETVFKSTSLAATVAGIAMSGRANRTRPRAF
ncbi:hypothetical protein CKM354_000582100 [Cercospora kikuchii]|uniref:HIG1 domain-containing protein n=1 Tax=Cercospora kikuchii TaxID=84275 RepID=A0A9P3CGN9_9PEZI|nr:uncharacterized protein CKM354_000582100 [Cercospora kikuchii]GIZ42559.1 hypothetical protein CKM354_000582100 [Cercospora kikuchii]